VTGWMKCFQRYYLRLLENNLISDRISSHEHSLKTND